MHFWEIKSACRDAFEAAESHFYLLGGLLLWALKTLVFHLSYEEFAKTAGRSPEFQHLVKHYNLMMNFDLF